MNADGEGLPPKIFFTQRVKHSSQFNSFARGNLSAFIRVYLRFLDCIGVLSSKRTRTKFSRFTSHAAATLFQKVMASRMEQSLTGHRNDSHFFATTHWSVVLSAGNASSPHSTTALTKLYQQYWYPLYSYLRRRGYDHHDIEDLLQAFFERLLERNILSGIVRDRGQFRAFLLTAVNNFLHDEWDRRTTQKRGGGQTFVPLPDTDAEQRYARELVDVLSADKLYQRRWITTLLENVLKRLERECQVEGGTAFDLLKVYLLGETGVPTYAATAAELSMTEGAVRVAVHRLRKRYAELFREEILQTVASPTDLQEEVRHLLAALSD